MAATANYSKSKNADYGKITPKPDFFCMGDECKYVPIDDNNAVIVAKLSQVPGIENYNDKNWRFEPSINLIQIYRKPHKVSYQGKDYDRSPTLFMQSAVEFFEKPENIDKYHFDFIFSDSAISFRVEPSETPNLLKEVDFSKLGTSSGGGKGGYTAKSYSVILKERITAYSEQLKEGSELDALCKELQAKGIAVTPQSVIELSLSSGV